ncbi:hypothetical protein MED297_02040 [Reinekea sp. MED297]|uniref:Uncharacterized protein n=1 Tax=Reinekea blandensis MED297 TaxID=314283 RepID=A4BJG9_9GAMM|nr:hypothetical protein MED297_02040 [Reinekea sp. MED297] [Reinekea blandensis MED297]
MHCALRARGLRRELSSSKPDTHPAENKNGHPKEQPFLF